MGHESDMAVITAGQPDLFKTVYKWELSETIPTALALIDEFELGAFLINFLKVGLSLQGTTEARQLLTTTNGDEREII